jgi:hypothetical protein
MEKRAYSFFFGALCTIPLPLYPSDEIPEMGSEFWFYCQILAPLLSPFPSLFFPSHSLSLALSLHPKQDNTITTEERKSGKHTFKYSLVASWYSLFIVPGDPLANILIATNTASETPTPSTVYPATFQPSPGGVWARGPWAPNAM